jgi:NADPH-dependent glutamate synthase beta subunit-like oxidoreductase
MPWPTLPMTLKVTSSHEEGSHRHWAIATKAFLGDEQGHLKSIESCRPGMENGPMAEPPSLWK